MKQMESKQTNQEKKEKKKNPQLLGELVMVAQEQAALQLSFVLPEVLLRLQKCGWAVVIWRLSIC